MGAQGDQRGGGVTEASSLLGGSPRRPCGQKGSPYHTGQLHPVALVADLLQHINQVKTAEGYGFKQDKSSSPAAKDACTEDETNHIVLYVSVSRLLKNHPGAKIYWVEPGLHIPRERLTTLQIAAPARALPPAALRRLCWAAADGKNVRKVWGERWSVSLMELSSMPPQPKKASVNLDKPTCSKALFFRYPQSLGWILHPF
ncbi:hypothetical protein MJG53_002518 [Ovis ammon polii x Ovis aries]|uniref:Uncharacterized protein n=1 Tax=Ovis ammon polii x Ovis aries TaxID=2918886 RepID=A0ACB9VE76_9CETA|nr:hypothetical protein MJG53_002518 [Ovis ammon polii x Ovis aries]